MSYLRGQIVQADVGLDEPKLFVIVSNNTRNAHLPSVLAARITSTPKRPISSIVEIDQDQGHQGRVICDDIVELYEHEILRVFGGFTAPMMSKVNAGLRAALGLS